MADMELEQFLIWIGGAVFLALFIGPPSESIFFGVLVPLVFVGWLFGYPIRLKMHNSTKNKSYDDDFELAQKLANQSKDEAKQSNKNK